MRRPAILLLAALATACSGRFGAGSRKEHGSTIVVRGSDTMVVLAQHWAEAYGREHPNLTLQVSGGGSGTGIAALENGTTDVATASRAMSAEERAKIRLARGADVVETPVCTDAIAVYVHRNNPIQHLTLAQLSDLFRGRIHNWSELGGPSTRVVLYSRENSSGTYAYFKEHVLKQNDFVAEAQSLPGTAAVLYAVAHDPYGIGYGGVSYARGVRVVPLVGRSGKDVLPSAETAASGEYPLSRPLYVYRIAEGNVEAAAFVRWLGSEPARTLARSAGFFPLAEGS